MVKSKLALLVLTGLMAAYAHGAEPTPEELIRKSVETKLTEGVKIDSIKKTPYSDLYEVRAGGNLLYADKKGEYIFVGEVFNAKTAQNLTRERLDEINKIKFSDLPLEMAVKLVKGNGKRVIAIFEDPNCSACKHFRQSTIKEMDNVTVYTFLYNILAEDSAVKSKNIWCAPDRSKAWDDWLMLGTPPPTAPAACPSPNDNVTALGRKMRVTATPTIFFGDGTRIAGAADTKGMEAKLATLK